MISCSPKVWAYSKFVLYGHTQLCIWDRDRKFFRDIAKFAKTRFDTNECSKNDNRAVPVGKNKNFISMMKDEISKKNHFRVCCIKDKGVCYRKIDRKL